MRRAFRRLVYDRDGSHDSVKGNSKTSTQQTEHLRIQYLVVPSFFIFSFFFVFYFGGWGARRHFVVGDKLSGSRCDRQLATTAVHPTMRLLPSNDKCLPKKRIYNLEKENNDDIAPDEDIIQGSHLGVQMDAGQVRFPSASIQTERKMSVFLFFLHWIVESTQQLKGFLTGSSSFSINKYRLEISGLVCCNGGKME